MKSLKLAALGLTAVAFAGASFAQTPSDKSGMMSAMDKKTMTSCMGMSHDMMMKDAKCTAMMKKMNMTDADMTKMMACKKMDHDMMMKDEGCMTMSKMHPDMMQMNMGKPS